MSGVDEPERNIMMFCAACGIAGVDAIKLKKCTACYLVRYCSIKCQRDHRPQHKKECKKRAAELRDEILFRQPESTHLGDCPICCLPLPLGRENCTIMECCSNTVCDGCYGANMIREQEQKLKHTCPFCRNPAPESSEDVEKNLIKRMEVNDAFAFFQMGWRMFHHEKDYKSSFEYYSKAAALGNIESHFQLSILYRDGEGVGKDRKKEVYHLEEAAIGGHPDARLNLGCIEEDNGRDDRAVKHWIIAANMGHDNSLENLKLVYREGLPASPRIYREGLVSKEDFASALRAHQTAVDATKSPQRETAERFWREEAARGDFP
eukprot:scaffold17964_cov127-Skeletonema_marinoi.AAC.7